MSEKKYDPIGCEHKGSWMFQSDECGSGPDFNHNVSIVVCKLCGTIRISGFRQDKDGNINRFSEEISIHSADAIEAMIKYANFIHEKEIWGHIDKPQQSAVWVKASAKPPVCEPVCFAKIKDNLIDGDIRRVVLCKGANPDWFMAFGIDLRISVRIDQVVEWFDESGQSKEGNVAKQIDRDWLTGALVQFALLYHQSNNKDIANDAAEYLNDILKAAGIDYVLSEDESPAAGREEDAASKKVIDRIKDFNLSDVDAPVFTHTKEFRAHFSYIKGKLMDIIKKQ